jgi:hypothetical protein
MSGRSLGVEQLRALLMTVPASAELLMRSDAAWLDGSAFLQESIVAYNDESDRAGSCPTP